MPLTGNTEQSFAPLPPEPNGRNKSIGAHDRIPPNPANSTHRCTITFADEAFRNSTLPPGREEPAIERSPTSHKRNPRTASFIETGTSSPLATSRRSRRRGTAKKAERRALDCQTERRSSAGSRTTRNLGRDQHQTRATPPPPGLRADAPRACTRRPGIPKSGATTPQGISRIWPRVRRRPPLTVPGRAAAMPLPASSTGAHVEAAVPCARENHPSARRTGRLGRLPSRPPSMAGCRHHHQHRRRRRPGQSSRGSCGG